MKTKLMAWIILSAFMSNAVISNPGWANTDSKKVGSMMGESSAGNGEGFTLVGNWPGADIPIHFPEFSKEELEKIKEEVLKSASVGDLTYKDLFAPGDQLAFDKAQAEIYQAISRISESFYKMKQAVVRAVVIIKEYEKSHPEKVDVVTTLYKAYLREMMLNVLLTLAPVGPTGGRSNFRNIDQLDVHPGMLQAAKECKTEVCVFEIQKLAAELMQLSFDWDKKIKFQKMINGKKGVFVEAAHPMIRGAVSKYVLSKVEGKSGEELRLGLTAVTDLSYVQTIVPESVSEDFARIAETLNFSPGLYDRADGRYGTDGFKESFKEIWSTWREAWSNDPGGTLLFHLGGVAEAAMIFAHAYVGVWTGPRILLTNPKKDLMKRMSEQFSELANEKLRRVLN